MRLLHETGWTRLCMPGHGRAAGDVFNRPFSMSRRLAARRLRGRHCLQRHRRSALWLAARRSANIASTFATSYAGDGLHLFTGWGYVVSSPASQFRRLANASGGCRRRSHEASAGSLRRCWTAAVFVGAVGRAAARLVSTSRNSQSRQRAVVSGCQGSFDCGPAAAQRDLPLWLRARRPVGDRLPLFPIASP